MTKTKMIETRGYCDLCHQVFDKRVMTKHLKNHLAGNAGDFPNFHLLVQDKYTPYYWLHLLVPENSTLEKLDMYLRDIWLECCGHISMFRIGDDDYSSHPDPEYSDQNIKMAVSKVLEVGKSFGYVYDLGTTSELILKTISLVKDKNRGDSIKLLARNEPPIMICGECGSKAAQICSECGWDEENGLLCGTHTKSHEHDQEMFLPIVNSPRVGMCGYTG